MTTEDREHLLEKLRKLKAMAEGAAHVGNEAEAEAFAAKVQELLLRHKLSMSELDLATQDEVDEIEREGWAPPPKEAKSRRMYWEERLALAVAHAHFCELVVFHHANRLSFIGRESDRKIATFVYTVLHQYGLDATRKAYRKAKREAEEQGLYWGKGFHQSFLLAYATTIADRYAAERRRFEDAVRKAGQGTSLVRLSQALAQVNAWMAANMRLGVSQGPAAPSRHNLAGVEAGIAHGSKVNIRPGGVEAGTPAQKLSGAKAMLAKPKGG